VSALAVALWTAPLVGAVVGALRDQASRPVAQVSREHVKPEHNGNDHRAARARQAPPSGRLTKRR
jgi:hypothetical protein